MGFTNVTAESPSIPQEQTLSGFVAALIVACNARKERLLPSLVQLGELVANTQSLSAPQSGRQATMVVYPQAISTLLYFESFGWHLAC